MKTFPLIQGIAIQANGARCFLDSECQSSLCVTADGGFAGANQPGSCVAYCY